LAVDRVAQILGIRMDRLMLEKMHTLELNQLRRYAESRNTKTEEGSNG